MEQRNYSGYSIVSDDLTSVPLFTSDADAPSGSDIATVKKGEVLKMVTQVQGQFPTRAVEILKFFIADKETKGPKGADGSKLSDYVNVLKENQIAQIYGHAEQIMGRFIDHLIIPRIKSLDDQMYRGEAGVGEVWLLQASLFDCCWWCGPNMASRTGRIDLGEGRFANMRMIMTTGYDFAGLVRADAGGYEHVTSVRSRVIRRDETIDLSTVPFIFNFQEMAPMRKEVREKKGDEPEGNRIPSAYGKSL